jgi:hypothetical protein
MRPQPPSRMIGSANKEPVTDVPHGRSRFESPQLHHEVRASAGSEPSLLTESEGRSGESRSQRERTGSRRVSSR